MKADQYFSSKILLFGEYSVLKGSMALAMPYSSFKGRLTFKESGLVDSCLKGFVDFLKQNLSFTKVLDAQALEQDILNGLYFDSTIPRGMGLGSSGALCAALLTRYQVKATKNIATLKTFFSKVEGYFHHGSSSGLDPLISYFNQPLMINETGDLNRTSMPHFEDTGGALFLLKTDIVAKRPPLFKWFEMAMKDEVFRGHHEHLLCPAINGCINAFLGQDHTQLFKYFMEISDFQRKNFTTMIPEDLQEIWQYGLDSNKYALKLCGAGGGGYFLGITPDLEFIKTIYSKISKIKIIMRI